MFKASSDCKSPFEIHYFMLWEVCFSVANLSFGAGFFAQHKSIKSHHYMYFSTTHHPVFFFCSYGATCKREPNISAKVLFPILFDYPQMAINFPLVAYM